MADPPRAYSEKDWNETSVKLVEEKGSEAGWIEIYSTSKVKAEKGVHVFASHKLNLRGWLEIPTYQLPGTFTRSTKVSFRGTWQWSFLPWSSAFVIFLLPLCAGILKISE
jgi:hypothetical protein